MNRLSYVSHRPTFIIFHSSQTFFSIHNSLNNTDQQETVLELKNNRYHLLVKTEIV